MPNPTRPDGRFVYVNKAQYQFLGALLATLPDPAKPYYGHLMDLLIAYDAAPADPAQAVCMEMMSILDADIGPEDATGYVLRALGAPTDA